MTTETQHSVGLDANGVTEAFLLQQTQQLRPAIAQTTSPRESRK
jgi:hypothetical protein